MYIADVKHMFRDLNTKDSAVPIAGNKGIVRLAPVRTLFIHLAR